MQEEHITPSRLRVPRGLVLELVPLAIVVLLASAYPLTLVRHSPFSHDSVLMTVLALCLVNVWFWLQHPRRLRSAFGYLVVSVVACLPILFWALQESMTRDAPWDVVTLSVAWIPVVVSTSIVCSLLIRMTSRWRLIDAQYEVPTSIAIASQFSLRDLFVFVLAMAALFATFAKIDGIQRASSGYGDRDGITTAVYYLIAAPAISLSYLCLMRCLSIGGNLKQKSICIAVGVAVTSAVLLLFPIAYYTTRVVWIDFYGLERTYWGDVDTTQISFLFRDVRRSIGGCFAGALLLLVLCAVIRRCGLVLQSIRPHSKGS
jgi:hypothetical protein